MNLSANTAGDYFSACGRTGTALTDCLVIDAHGHYGPWSSFNYVSSTADSLIKVMDRIGIDRLCLSSTWAISVHMHPY